ncbi:hypothetical protein Cch01nite_32720 [Cellulomonas chitinilytica]|uniref:Uncharacterized protein n=2 Tax=Cellulomonas chitinilytica TaxID=398759 RepID=A0A919P3G6_9CELL|nr:hypothetical protein Cch01nite_32720 [Cellulomonas chitinilytica]
MISDLPVKLAVVRTPDEAERFPAQAVLEDAPSTARHVRAVALGVLVGVVLAVAFADRWIWFLPLVVLAAAMVLAVVNWKIGSPAMYPVALVLTVAAFVVLRPAAGALVLVAALGGGWFAAHRGDEARRRRWARTAGLLERQVRTDAVVTALRSQVVSAPVNFKLEITLSSTTPGPDGSPLTWTFTTFSNAYFHPREGSGMTVWYDPDDPAVAAVAVVEQPSRVTAQSR